MERTRLKPWNLILRKLRGSMIVEDQPGAERDREQPLFTYTPLPPGTIRLLYPNEQGNGLSWRLEIANIDDGKCKFDALSYTWGPQNETFPISLNDHRATVHHNLYTALPYLAARQRRRWYTRPIWVDAICINQADEQEKTKQIALMNVIYRRAKQVWVWLGLADHQERMPEAISLLPQFYAAGLEIKTHPLREERAVLEKFGLTTLEQPVWRVISHVWHNPWFTRVWV